jgi:uncharacterized membrane protein
MTLQRRHIVIGAVVALTVVIAIALLMMHSLGDADAKKADDQAQRVAPVVLAVHVLHSKTSLLSRANSVPSSRSMFTPR